MTAVACPASGKENVLRERKAGDSRRKQKCTKNLSQFVAVLDARIPNTNTKKYIVLSKMALLNDYSRPKYVRVSLLKYHRRDRQTPFKEHWGQRQGDTLSFTKPTTILLCNSLV